MAGQRSVDCRGFAQACRNGAGCTLNRPPHPLPPVLACAGLFGVGGGIIKAPLMLEMGVCPEVAAATSATMILVGGAGRGL